MDGTELGVTTALLMEKIEETYGEDAEIVDALVIAEVSYKDPDEEDTRAFEWYCTSPRTVIREGLIALAHKSSPFADVGDPDYDPDEED